jgi:hypothetical protein
MTLYIVTSLRAISASECLISRVLGSIVISVAAFSLLFNIRFLHWSASHGRNRSRHNMFMISMIFSSIMVTLVMLPAVSLQCWTCNRLQSLIYCQLEGFVSYLNGCVHMFMLMMISIFRYITVLHTGATRRYFLRKSYLAVLVSWLLGLAFAVPPLFNLNKYIPEGLGYHCGLNWFDRSKSSHAYLFAAMLFVYFIPLIVLCLVNMYVYCIIRRLLNRAMANNVQSLAYIPLINIPSGKRLSPAFISLSSSTTKSVRYRDFKRSLPSNERIRNNTARQSIDPFQLRHTLRLNRLKADRHFALATIFLVSEYLLSWTPYACIALFYLFRVNFINEQPLMITACASIAKISMIINPFVYVLAIKYKQVKLILSGKKCSCSHCRSKKTGQWL